MSKVKKKSVLEMSKKEEMMWHKNYKKKEKK